MPRGKVIIDRVACKGCELCISACTFGVLAVEEAINQKGYQPAFPAHPEKCTGCAQCALMCPDLCITVERES